MTKHAVGIGFGVFGGMCLRGAIEAAWYRQLDLLGFALGGAVCLIALAFTSYYWE